MMTLRIAMLLMVAVGAVGHDALLPVHASDTSIEAVVLIQRHAARLPAEGALPVTATRSFVGGVNCTIECPEDGVARTRAVDEDRGKRDVVMLLHTPKVAGTSLLDALRSLHRMGYGRMWEPVFKRVEETCPNESLCACFERQDIQFVSDEVGVQAGSDLQQMVWQSCGQRVRLVTFFREPVSTAVSTFLQGLDHDCSDPQQVKELGVVCRRHPDPLQLFEAFLDDELCAATMAMCTNKQSRFAGVSENCSSAGLDAALSPFHMFGIVEAFDVSLCLLAHTLRLRTVFESMCGEGITMRLAVRDNVAVKSQLVLDRVRANATLLQRVRQAHAVDELLYRHAVARFVTAVSRMSCETGLNFQLPAGLLRIAQQQEARLQFHDPSALCADVQPGSDSAMLAMLPTTRAASPAEPQQSLAEILAMPPKWRR